MTKKTDGPVYYEAQEKALAPGIADGWPATIRAPHTKNGRLKKLDPAACKKIAKFLMDGGE